MREKYSGKIDNLIALCHIIDKFVEFEKRLLLLNVLPSKYNGDFVNQLWEVSSGKSRIGARKAKRFYSENKEVIDTINKYSSIIEFIHSIQTVDLHCFYKYISNHKDKMDKILAVLERLKKLGFSRLEFDESNNFIDEIYVIHTLMADCFNFVYLDQMEAIPRYRDGKIQYRTKGSPYKIMVSTIGGGKLFRGYYDTILLNDLTFEPNRLPSALSKEETFDKIIGLTAQKQQQYSAIKDSVDLGVGIADLYAMYDKVNDTINGLSNTDRKEELIKSLTTIKEEILKMQTISSEYDQTIVKNNPDISQAVLDEEKKAYARRRKSEDIHIW